MINESTARAAADQALMRFMRDPDVPALEIMECEEQDIGWIIYYQAARYAETGNPMHMVAGNAPILVDREGGRFHTMGTARGVDFYVAEYRAGRHSCELCAE